MLRLGLLTDQFALLLPRLELPVVRILARLDPAALLTGERPGVGQRHSFGAAQGQLLALAAGPVGQAGAGIARRRMHQHEARHAAKITMLDAIVRGRRNFRSL